MCMPLPLSTHVSPDERNSSSEAVLGCFELVACCFGKKVIRVVSQSSKFVVVGDKTARPSSTVLSIVNPHQRHGQVDAEV